MPQMRKQKLPPKKKRVRIMRIRQNKEKKRLRQSQTTQRINHGRRKNFLSHRSKPKRRLSS